MGSAALATLLGVLLLGSGLGTWSEWREQDSRQLGTVTAGSVDLTNSTMTVQLQSRQPADSRTYASSATCPDFTPGVATDSFKACRVVTTTLPQERLIPGDRLVVVQNVTLAGAGANLQGTLTIDATGLLNQADGASPLALAATVSGVVSAPHASGVGLEHAFTVGPGTTKEVGFGSYAMAFTIDIPMVDNIGDPWGQRLWDQTLELGEITILFVQTQA